MKSGTASHLSALLDLYCWLCSSRAVVEVAGNVTKLLFVAISIGTGAIRAAAIRAGAIRAAAIEATLFRQHALLKLTKQCTKREFSGTIVLTEHGSERFRQ